MAPKFKNTYCSQCGESFGPGDSGYSHCESHQKISKQKTLFRQLWINVNDELPKETGIYYTRQIHGSISPEDIIILCQFQQGQHPHFIVDGWTKVTHWMPRPIFED